MLPAWLLGIFHENVDMHGVEEVLSLLGIKRILFYAKG